MMAFSGLRRSAVLTVVVVVAALTGCTPAPPPPPAGVTTPEATQTWHTEMLAAVNAQRAAVGAPSVSLCGTLTVAAQAHSEDQAARRTMSHVGGDGSGVDDRAERAGYLGWSALGENVAYGYSQVSTVMAAWMASPGHRDNLLDPDYSHLGVGSATSTHRYWTQVFGRGGTC